MSLNNSGLITTGSIGPAGGIIFLNKGVHKDGWQFLEAAPKITEFSSEWGALGIDVVGTLKCIGCGKNNTVTIVKYLNSLKIFNSAAHKCVALEINGYKDWFLPSIDEMSLMYENVIRPIDEHWIYDYWSSSQEDLDSAWLHVLYKAEQLFDKKSCIGYVRACRSF